MTGGTRPSDYLYSDSQSGYCTTTPGYVSEFVPSLLPVRTPLGCEPGRRPAQGVLHPGAAAHSHSCDGQRAMTAAPCERAVGSGLRVPRGLLVLALVAAMHTPRAGVCGAGGPRLAPPARAGRTFALRGGGAAGAAGAVHSEHGSKRLRRPRDAAESPPPQGSSSTHSDMDAESSHTATEVIAQELIETRTVAAARSPRAAAPARTSVVEGRTRWGDGAHGGRRPFARGAVMEVLEAEFGIRSFRDGQEETISRVLAGNNTLFLSATGSGKSLTYLLPTLLWKRRRAAEGGAGGARTKRGARRAAEEEAGGSVCDGGGGGGGGGETGLTLVISPLLALIRDQLQHLPAGLSGASLSSEMSSSEQGKVTQLLLAQQLDILYVAPERLLSPPFMKLMLNLTKGSVRPLQLVVIDEAVSLHPTP